MATYQLIWTQRACDDFRRGRWTKYRLAHTISNIPDQNALRAFEEQIRRDTPRIVRSAGDGFDWASEREKAT